jgi:hypothetical protein
MTLWIQISLSLTRFCESLYISTSGLYLLAQRNSVILWPSQTSTFSLSLELFTLNHQFKDHHKFFWSFQVVHISCCVPLWRGNCNVSKNWDMVLEYYSIFAKHGRCHVGKTQEHQLSLDERWLIDSFRNILAKWICLDQYFTLFFRIKWNFTCVN